MVEAVTNATAIADQLQVDLPGHWLNCGGTGLGWAGGVSRGVKLALDAKCTPNFVCQIAGDGAFSLEGLAVRLR